MIYHLNLEILQINNIHHLSMILDIIIILCLKKKLMEKKMVPFSIVKNRKKMKNHKSRRFIFKMIVGIQINNFSNPQVLETHIRPVIKI